MSARDPALVVRAILLAAVAVQRRDRRVGHAVAARLVRRLPRLRQALGRGRGPVQRAPRARRRRLVAGPHRADARRRVGARAPLPHRRPASPWPSRPPRTRSTTSAPTTPSTAPASCSEPQRHRPARLVGARRRPGLPLAAVTRRSRSNTQRCGGGSPAPSYAAVTDNGRRSRPRRLVRMRTHRLGGLATIASPGGHRYGRRDGVDRRRSLRLDLVRPARAEPRTASSSSSTSGWRSSGAGRRSGGRRRRRRCRGRRPCPGRRRAARRRSVSTPGRRAQRNMPPGGPVERRCGRRAARSSDVGQRRRSAPRRSPRSRSTCGLEEAGAGRARGGRCAG